MVRRGLKDLLAFEEILNLIEREVVSDISKRSVKVFLNNNSLSIVVHLAKGLVVNQRVHCKGF